MGKLSKSGRAKIDVQRIGKMLKQPPWEMETSYVKVEGRMRRCLTRVDTLRLLERETFPSGLKSRPNIPIREIVTYMYESQSQSPDRHSPGAIILRRPHYVTDFLRPLKLRPKLAFQNRVMVEIIDRVLTPLGVRGESEFRLNRCIPSVNYRVDYFIPLSVSLIIEINETHHQTRVREKLNDAQKKLLNQTSSYRVLMIDEKDWRKKAYRLGILNKISGHIMKHDWKQALRQLFSLSDDSIAQLKKAFGEETIIRAIETNDAPQIPLKQALAALMIDDESEIGQRIHRSFGVISSACAEKSTGDEEELSDLDDDNETDSDRNLNDDEEEIDLDDDDEEGDEKIDLDDDDEEGDDRPDETDSQTNSFVVGEHYIIENDEIYITLGVLTVLAADAKNEVTHRFLLSVMKLVMFIQNRMKKMLPPIKTYQQQRAEHDAILSLQLMNQKDDTERRDNYYEGRHQMLLKEVEQGIPLKKLSKFRRYRP